MTLHIGAPILHQNQILNLEFAPQISEMIFETDAYEIYSIDTQIRE